MIVNTWADRSVPIWTQAYRPFAVTGVHEDIRTVHFGQVNEHQLLVDPCGAGRDQHISIYEIESPKTGATWFVEPKSNGLLGNDLTAIEHDLSTHFLCGGTMTQLLEQLDAMERKHTYALYVKPRRFWDLLENQSEDLATLWSGHGRP